MKETAHINLIKTSHYDQKFSYLREVIYYRLKKEFANEDSLFPVFEQVISDESEFSIFAKKYKLDYEEVLVLLIALVPNILPSFFTDIIADFFPNGGEFPGFGGVKGKNHRGILPTGETLLYILAGDNTVDRAKILDRIIHNSVLFKNGILEMEKVPYGEPFMSGKIILNNEYVLKLLTGNEIKPELSQEFPASLITTNLNWDDLVLSNKTLSEVREIENWLEYNDILMNDWGMQSKIKPGYRVLFCGLPGTGKTLTASLLGKYTGKDVYRVDLSMVVSKYIGETEKNLSKLFDKSINKDWILFFDEADSIFGKRTNIRDAHDKYANQEVSYLLQRIEAHPGLIILASNFKNNIDAAVYSTLS